MNEFISVAYPISVPIVFFSALLYLFITDAQIGNELNPTKGDGAREQVGLALICAIGLSMGWPVCLVFGAIYLVTLLVREFGIYIGKYAEDELHDEYLALFNPDEDDDQDV